MKKIAIIGGGFSGTMTAVHLVSSSDQPVEIHLIDRKKNLSRGLAYNPYTKAHLLNVTTDKMSAFPEDPRHFLDWVIRKNLYPDLDEAIIANAFLPRSIYGEYLEDIWARTMQKIRLTEKRITCIDSKIVDFDYFDDHVRLVFENGDRIHYDYCVIATGNEVPGNIPVPDPGIFSARQYHQNPWKAETVEHVNSDLPVLIIGNGLTMVDTVLGLRERRFSNLIYSISPNGFNILPHRHPGVSYDSVRNDIPNNPTLSDIVASANTHIKRVRELGVSAEPIINALRADAQSYWANFSDSDKEKFHRRLRHLWGVARHRIPLHTHDFIQQQRIDGKLKIVAGDILDIKIAGYGVKVKYFNKKANTTNKILVSRIINCTGPSSDITKSPNALLKNMLNKGYIEQDRLKLGIQADPETYFTISAKIPPRKVYVIGSLLRGVLWESTSVNDLREQAKTIADAISGSLRLHEN